MRSEMVVRVWVQMVNGPVTHSVLRVPRALSMGEFSGMTVTNAALTELSQSFHERDKESLNQRNEMSTAIF